MKMEEMKAYLENKGFEVRSEYVRHHGSTNSCYIFNITKNGFSHADKYVWPADQKRFMDRMIADWERDYRKRTECKFQTMGTVDDLSKLVFNEHYNFGHVIVGDDMYSKIFPVRFSNVTIDRSPYASALASIECELISASPNEPVPMWTKQNPWLQPQIKNVIHNEPATIVFWTDGTKTVVKCQDDDIYDPEKGLAMAISKKVFGNKGNYCNQIKKWLPENNTTVILLDGEKLRKAISDAHRLPYAIDDIHRCKESVKKAYDELVAYRDSTNPNNEQLNPDRDAALDLDEIIGYLGEALED